MIGPYGRLPWAGGLGNLLSTLGTLAQPTARRWLMIRVLGAVAAVVAAIALVRDTAANGHDFVVFWRAGRSLWDGQALYSVARDGAMVFKYPPWIAPAFVPIALLPLAWAKWLWGGIEVFSLLMVILWAKKRAGIHTGMLAVGTAAFWGLWAVHALDGQIVLPMLALALWSWEIGAEVLLLWVLTAKVFSLAAMPGFYRPLTVKRGQAAVLAALLFSALSLPALRAEGWSPPRLFSAWAAAASSGYREFGAEHIFGRTNQGLPALILRLEPSWMPIPGADLALAAVLFVILGGIWWRVAPRDRRVAWAGWLALVPVVHPLPWWHLFIFAFPAALLAMEQALGFRRVLSGIGIFLLAMATEKMIGKVGVWAELASAKSWGVLLCLACLAESPKFRSSEPGIQAY